MAAVLVVENMKTQFKTENGVVKAVDGVSYHVDENEIIGIVGESGCGKSVTQLSVLQLIATPPGEIVDGKVIFEGKNPLDYSPKGSEMYAVRGGKIAMIFQEPMTSLNPVLTISRQLTEMLEVHLNMTRPDSRKRSIELLKLVGIPDPGKRIDDYPYQFSGGLCRRRYSSQLSHADCHSSGGWCDSCHQRPPIHNRIRIIWASKAEPLEV